jgi:hypothetical protein
LEAELVRSFLNEFKKISTEGRGIDFVPRRKNVEDLAVLGLTKNNAKLEILGLAATDYCGGPKPDKDRPGEIWEFGKIIMGKEIYIKLKIARVDQTEIAKCISFHLAEH